MGQSHARQFRDGRIPGAALSAVCDQDVSRCAAFPGATAFSDAKALWDSGLADAVVIATPHTLHVPQCLGALRAGLHVLVEKPLAVEVAEARRLLREARRDRQMAIMFNQRTDPRYRKARELVASGQLGALQRIHWTVTDWFRTDAYYASSGWRATWAGEGGGVLLNQAPHNLDLWQWIFGMPATVQAFCRFGRHHRIEVEDEVTAYLEYAGGASGIFITSTGEAPGVNRLEAWGDRGRLLVEGDAVVLWRNEPAASVFRRESRDQFARPATQRQDWTFDSSGGQHGDVLRNFVRAVRGEETLLAPAAEGARSLELANAMILSTVRGRPVKLPVPAAAYHRALARLIARRPRRRKTS